MEKYYHPLPEHQRPHVLALTASPIKESGVVQGDGLVNKAKLMLALKDLQTALDCRIVAAAEEGELQDLVHKAEVVPRPYRPLASRPLPLTGGLWSAGLQAINKAVWRARALELVTEHRANRVLVHGGPPQAPRGRGASADGETPSTDLFSGMGLANHSIVVETKKVLGQVRRSYEELGPLAAALGLSVVLDDSDAKGNAKAYKATAGAHDKPSSTIDAERALRSRMELGFLTGMDKDGVVAMLSPAERDLLRKLQGTPSGNPPEYVDVGCGSTLSFQVFDLSWAFPVRFQLESHGSRGQTRMMTTLIHPSIHSMYLPFPKPQTKTVSPRTSTLGP